MKNYSYTMTRFPEPPLDPPTPSDAEYDRNVRNELRRDAMADITRLIWTLDDLEHDGPHRITQEFLEQLHAYLEMELED